MLSFEHLCQGGGGGGGGYGGGGEGGGAHLNDEPEHFVSKQ